MDEKLAKSLKIGGICYSTLSPLKYPESVVISENIAVYSSCFRGREKVQLLTSEKVLARVTHIAEFAIISNSFSILFDAWSEGAETTTLFAFREVRRRNLTRPSVALHFVRGHDV